VNPGVKRMARPRKEGMDYFPHDTDATDDEKIDAMRALFGNDGYAFYFILCERIYRTNEAELDVSKPVLLLPIAKKLLVTQDRFDEMLDAAFELGLLSRDDYETRGVITSNGIKKRFDEVRQMRNRWRKNKDKTVIHEENPVENSGENAEETRESKAKKSKVKKSKVVKEYTPEFTAFWSVYPRPLGKLDAFDKWLKALEAGATAEKIIACAENYAKQCKHYETEERYIMHPKTFLYKSRFLDFETVTLSQPNPQPKVVPMRTSRTSIPVVKTSNKPEATQEDIDRILKMAERLGG